MVYCGKPSRGCQMCRTRRIKCDETKPICLQCQKSRRQCPGYKDDFDLVFRNETQATERRAHRSVNGKRVNTQVDQRAHQQNFSSTSEGSGSSSEVTLTSAASSASSLSVPEAFQVPVEQQALCFFLANFVLIPRQGTTRGYLDFLLPLIKTEDPDSHLSIAFQAVALASLGNRLNSKGSNLMNKAITQYAKALKVTNVALQDPVQQKTDQMLASVLLLGVFETITSQRTNIGAWGSHIDGAVQLVKMRGKKQLRTKIGHSLFIVVRAQMVINCMSASKAPQIGTDWWIADAGKDDIAQVVTRLNLRVAEIRAEVNRTLTIMPRTPDNAEKVLDLMRRAQAMEQGFVAWEQTLPEFWKFKTVAWIDNVPGGDLTKADVCPGKVDIYTDVWICSVWNLARVSRLFLSGIVVRCVAWVCAPVDYRTTPEYATAARLGAEMVSDIIASVPFNLGWHLDNEGELKASDLSGFACGEDNLSSPKALGGFFCIWPIFSANCSDFTTDSQRKWMYGRLVFIGETMGINQARVLSHFQLRLPSMIVRRDGMGHAYPDQKILASARGQSPTAGYAMNPLLKREAMQREMWEKGRRRY